MKISIFRGELTEIWAQKEALVSIGWVPKLKAYITDGIKQCTADMQILVALCKKLGGSFWEYYASRIQCYLIQPKCQLGHPENYLFSLSKKIFSGSKHPKNKKK